MVTCVPDVEARWSRCSNPVTLSSRHGRTMVIPTMIRSGRPPIVPVRSRCTSLLAYLVWAWHWAQPGEIPWEKACRVELDGAVSRRKREAVQCFTSQLTGPKPILSARTVRRLTTGLRSVLVAMTLKAPYFDRLYGSRPDPWDFRSRPYEIRKRASRWPVFPSAHYSTVFEPGCSIGVLTSDLAPVAIESCRWIFRRSRWPRLGRAFRPMSSFDRERSLRIGRPNRSNSLSSPRWAITSILSIVDVSGNAPRQVPETLSPCTGATRSTTIRCQGTRYTGSWRKRVAQRPE